MVEKVIHTEIIKSKFLNEQINVNKHCASLSQRKKIVYITPYFLFNR